MFVIDFGVRLVHTYVRGKITLLTQNESFTQCFYFVQLFPRNVCNQKITFNIFLELMLKYGKNTDKLERYFKYGIFNWHDGEKIKTCKVFTESVTDMFSW